PGNAQRRTSEEDPTAHAEIGVEQRVSDAEREDGIEDRLPASTVAAEVDQKVANQQAEPANFDSNGFGGQFPRRGNDRRAPMGECKGHACECLEKSVISSLSIIATRTSSAAAAKDFVTGIVGAKIKT